MSGPAITVKDVWRGALPDGTELLAGGAGLGRRVEWACALRTRPPAFDPMKGGEIAFVPVHSIRVLDDRLDLQQVMSSFAEKGGVAVAVVGDASAGSIDLADRLVMPLLHLPDSVHITDAHHACVRFILDQRALLHERALELQSSLMQLALSGAGPAAIVDRLAETSSLVAAWIDRAGAVRAVAGHDGELLLSTALSDQIPALQRWADTVAVVAADPPVREFALETAELCGLASPIPARDGVAGFVVVVGGDAQLDQLARLAVSRAASTCAIELDRERAVTETHERLEGEFVESLLSGTYSSEEAVAERARRLGVDIGATSVVAVIRGSRPADAEWLEATTAAARNALARRQLDAMVAAHDGAVCALLTSAAESGEANDGVLVKQAETVRSECSQVTGDAGASLGLGRPHPGLAGIRDSYREAEHALAMVRRFVGTGRTVRFSDLGLHRLLFAVAQQPELHDFYREAVGHLVAYDQRTKADFMRTLEAFFECNGSPTETAQKLKLHRNTVLYRLRRIQEVGRLNLDDAGTRLNLQLCLRVRDVLQALSERPGRVA